MSVDDPKFSAFYGWGLHLNPNTKKRKPTRAKQSPPPAPIKASGVQRLWSASRYYFPSFVVQVLAGVATGILLIFIAMWISNSHSESAPPVPTSEAAHPWDEDMMVVPTK